VNPTARDHALAVLELDRVLDLVAGHASSAAGAARVRSLAPMTAEARVAAEHERVEAMRTLVTSEMGWASEPIPDLAAALERLRVEGASWSGPELRAACVLLASSRRTLAALRHASRDPLAVAPLAEIARALLSDPEGEQALDRVVNEEGSVRDGASPLLRRTRKALRGAEGELVRLLERVMAKLDARHRVDDASVTLRNGRYVIPVRREGRGAVGGIVHDASASGGTLFIEPPAGIEAGNRIRELEAEEVREVERVLREATDRLRPHGDALGGALDALETLDSLLARARYAIACACAPVALAGPGTGFTIVCGRHPLLLAQDPAAVVPFDLVLGADERTLLVSGPNTGGKTVLLKSVALVSAMTQCGVPAPVGPGSRVAVFDRFFADIGDEQSIAASLSTFSAHLRNLTEIVREATPRSLALVDELGSGTDPVEGAALGGAILEALTGRGTTTIASTHLGALKELAHEVRGVVNASLQFDEVALVPTFHLVKGVPGRSYGLSIARRLEMPGDILDNAERRVPEGERDVSALLEDLERRQRALAEREVAAAERAEALSARGDHLAARERRVREQERELERSARQEARRYLLDARHQIEQTIRALKAAGAVQIEEAAAAARREAEKLAAAEAERLAALETGPGVARPEPDVAGRETEGETEGVTVGAAVAVAALGGKAGRVVELRDGEAVVAVGALKLAVPVGTLHRVPASRLQPVERAVALVGDQPEVVARHEVDVRGLRVGEVDEAVVQALDDAVRADLATLRVIHGKGTGALRARVTELLRSDRRVRAFRLGAWNEGGAGVTVAELA